MNEVHAVITMKPDVVEIAIGTTDIMGRVVNTARVSQLLPLNGETAKRHQAIGALVAFAIERGATSIEIIVDEE